MTDYKIEFQPKGKTRHHVVYEMTEKIVSNGKWYMVETTIPDIDYHAFKSYRSYDQAKTAFDKKVALEEWRSAGAIKINI